VRTQRILPLRAVELIFTAAAGGVLALGGAAALGKLGDHTTIQQVSPSGIGGFTSSTLGPGGRGLTTEEIYKRTSPGVVQITATSSIQSTNPFDIFPTQQTQEALGSGFVIDKAGHIVTNYHVIEGAQKVQVSFSQNDQIDAKVVGTDASTDLAVLQIDTHSRSLTPLPLGDSDPVQVGDPVVAIGNPFGFARTATAGIVSAVQRSIEAPNGVGIGHAIQTDAAINHGNSGGPLIDARGTVIGVNSQISTGNTGAEGNVGIGFAVPVNTVKTVAAQLIHGGKAQHPYLGIEARPITDELVRLFNLPVERGLIVTDVKSGSGAQKAGIKPGDTPVVVEGDTYQLGGDIIVGADGTPVTSVPQLRDLIARKKPGDKLELEIYRDAKKQTVGIKLGRQPPSPNG
jgi:S1-C subfamily serine protease